MSARASTNGASDGGDRSARSGARSRSWPRRVPSRASGASFGAFLASGAILAGGALVAILAASPLAAGEPAAPPAVPAETPPVRRGEMRRTLLLFEDAIRNEGTEPMRGVAVDALLPLDRDRQRLRWIRFSPHEWTFRTDEHGQRVATASVKEIPPGGAAVFSWVASVDVAEEIHTLPAAETPADAMPGGRSAAAPALPAAVARYLADAPQFGVRSDAVGRAADEVAAVAGGGGPAALVRAAAEHVRTRIEYRREGGWDPAPAVLERGTGSCSESTFAFVALCRRLGIPARWIGGTSLRDGPAGRPVDTTFHRIAEAWIPGHGWFPVETTAPRAREPEGALGRIPSGLLLLGVGDGTGDAGAGSSYFARERWAGGKLAKGTKEATRGAKQAKSRRMAWISGVEDELGLRGSLHGLEPDRHPSFGRAELLACDLRGFGPAAGADGKPLRGAAKPVRPKAEDVARTLLAAGHPEGVRIAAGDASIPRADAERMLREACDDALFEEVRAVLGRTSAEVESWWAEHVDRVIPVDRGRLSLRAK